MTSGGRWPVLARVSAEVGVVAYGGPVLSQASAEGDGDHCTVPLNRMMNPADCYCFYPAACLPVNMMRRI